MNALARVDSFSEVGCAASSDGSGRPMMKRLMVTINDGIQNLRFPAQADNGRISAIELLSAWR